MAQSNKTYFLSLDYALMLTLFSASGICFAIGHTEFNQSSLSSSIAFLTGVGTLVLFLIFGVPCSYTIEETTLRVRNGLVKHRIAYSDILDIRESAGLLPSLTPSQRSVEVRSTHGVAVINPRDREAFVQDLQRKVEEFRPNQTEAD